jgi:hypothetical protein
LTSAIRTARPDDATAIAELLGELGYPTDAKRFKGRLVRIEQDPSSRLFVATVDDRVAGLAGFHLLPLVEHDEPSCQLTALSAHAFYERLGFEATGLRFVKAL